MKILLFLFLACSQDSASKKLVIIGDSLSEGYGVAKAAAYPQLLENKLKGGKKDWVVVNSSISGSTSASAPKRVRWVLKSKPTAIFLALGANDGLRGLTARQMENNLSKAIDSAQKAGVKVILGGMYAPPNYGKKYGEEFKSVYRRLADKYKVHLVPFILKDVAGHSKHNLPDGIHPNEKGHEIMASTIYQSIKDKL